MITSANIKEVIAAQAEAGDLDTKTLKPGTVVKVKTVNSEYELTFTDPIKGKIHIRGGKRWQDGADLELNGSTWGGSMIRLGWIGIGMHMELRKPDVDQWLTSAVQSIDVLEPIAEP